MKCEIVKNHYPAEDFGLDTVDSEEAIFSNSETEEGVDTIED